MQGSNFYTNDEAASFREFIFYEVG
jgi:hypothetical protein